MRQKNTYKIINALILLIVSTLFVFVYAGDFTGLITNPPQALAGVVLTASIVHGIKALRFYFALFGHRMSFLDHVKQYCKVIPVSVLLPFKLGDVFRAYCYGYQIGSYYSGTIVVLFDRFVDTLALLTFIFLININAGFGFTWLFYALVIFSLGIITCYLIFPGMYSYWKHYILKLRASRLGNRFLFILDRMNESYLQISVVVRGKWIILYLLSLLAWAAEIGGLLLVSKIIDDSSSFMVTEYLTAALTGANMTILRWFILISILIMFGLYVILYLAKLWKGNLSHAKRTNRI